MAVTFGSEVMRSKACLIACGVAPPPTSRKFAGAPPLSFMMSMVAMARPAPLTKKGGEEISYLVGMGGGKGGKEEVTETADVTV